MSAVATSPCCAAVVLSPAERRAYLDVHAKAAALWASVRHFSPAAINQKLLQIMALLLPLRREWLWTVLLNAITAALLACC